jgi:hypothetical protein
MYYLNHYKVDWNKVHTINDIKKILQSLNLAFEPNCSTLESIREYVVLENKVPQNFVL